MEMENNSASVPAPGLIGVLEMAMGMGVNDDEETTKDKGSESGYDSPYASREEADKHNPYLNGEIDFSSLNFSDPPPDDDKEKNTEKSDNGEMDFATKNEARQALDGDLGEAANRFFRDAN